MISDKIAAAVKAISYPTRDLSDSEYSALWNACEDTKRELLREFCNQLAAEYASDFPEPVQEVIWAKSWNVAGRSYFDVELDYMKNADFARFARDTK